MPAYMEASSKGAGLFGGCYNSAETAPSQERAHQPATHDAPPRLPASNFNNSGVRVGEWWEHDAWRLTTGLAHGDRQRASAAVGSRPFGRREPCSEAENAARTDGRNTSSLISWGHEGRWDRGSNALPGAGPLPDSRPVRRNFIPPPSNAAALASIHGEQLTAGQHEAMHFQTGQVTTPGRRFSKEAMCAPPATSAAQPEHAPFARDDDVRAASAEAHGEPPLLFDAKTGVACVARGHGLAAGPTPQAVHLHGAQLREEEGGENNSSCNGSHRAGAGMRQAQTTTAVAAASHETPPPSILSPVIAEVYRLSRALADRGVAWELAFAPFDPARTGVVSLSDLLRVFRDAGLSPQPSLLREVRQPRSTPSTHALGPLPLHPNATRACTSCGPLRTLNIIRT